MTELAPCVFVLFGATGDLTRRKLAPALYALHRDGYLPPTFAVLAYARRDKDDAAFRDDMKTAIEEFAPDMPTEGAEWESFAARLFYQRGDFDKPDGYKALAERLTQMDADREAPCNRLFYMAIPPEQYETVIERLGKAKLAQTAPGCGAWTRVIVEKPFGYDLETSRQLNDTLANYFTEDQIYRIDHYLGKETVQNILVFRFANELFEPLWNHKYIDHVQITVAEKIGVEGRGNYFDTSGIARDMLQNHAMQILSLVAMEPPVSLDANAVRDEKVKAVRAIRPITKADVPRMTVRGQYSGYRTEAGVADGSITETYAALKLHVDNWRWAGTPFFVRAGKALPSRATEIAVYFKAIPQVLFAKMKREDVKPNVLVMRIQPDEGIHLIIGVKEPGQAMNLAPVDLSFSYREAFPKAAIADAYERLLLDAIRGDASLFTRGDEVQASWSLLTPVLEAWRETGRDVQPYFANTWGPERADGFLGEGRTWREP